MFYNILIVLAGLFALVEFVRSKDAFARVIMGVMIIAIGTTLVPDNSATELGFGIFLLSLLLRIPPKETFFI